MTLSVGVCPLVKSSGHVVCTARASRIRCALSFPVCAVFSVPFSQLALLRHLVQIKRSDDIHEAVSDGFTALIRQLIKRLLLPLSAELIDHVISSIKSPSLLLLLHCASFHCPCPVC